MTNSENFVSNKLFAQNPVVKLRTLLAVKLYYISYLVTTCTDTHIHVIFINKIISGS